MTGQEFLSVLRPWLDRQPFVPFAFVLTSGERRDVYTRAAIRYPDGSVAYLSAPGVALGEPLTCEDVERVEPLPRRETTVMTPDAFAAELRRLCGREPFRPFTVELKSGEHVEIDDPEGLAFAGGYATFLPAEGHPVEFDYTTVAKLIEPETASSA